MAKIHINKFESLRVRNREKVTCHKCGKQFKDTDIAVSKSGYHIKYYHKKCFEDTLH